MRPRPGRIPHRVRGRTVGLGARRSCAETAEVCAPCDVVA